MRTVPVPAHPDVTYWQCPQGDAHVVVLGRFFGLLNIIGQRVENADLADVLPRSVLEDAEAKVESHEQRHGVA